MSTTSKGKPEVDAAHGSSPVVSTRYDKRLIDWATGRLGCSKAELLKRALDEYMSKIVKEAA